MYKGQLKSEIIANCALRIKSRCFFSNGSIYYKMSFYYLVILLNCPCISFIHLLTFIKPLVSAFASGECILLKPVSLFTLLFFCECPDSLT